MTTRFLIALILLWTFTAALRGQTVEQACAYLIQYEGKTSTVVTRRNGERVVGIGHNVAFDRVVKDRYTDWEVERLFVRDFVIAIGACRRGVRDFDRLPLEVRLACVSIAFSVGPTGFQRFVNLRRALSVRWWEGAMVELADSRWRVQVQPARFNRALAALKAQITP